MAYLVSVLVSSMIPACFVPGLHENFGSAAVHLLSRPRRHLAIVRARLLADVCFALVAVQPPYNWK